MIMGHPLMSSIMRLGLSLMRKAHKQKGTAMETERLRQIEAIARLGTVSAAARELHMSQPALSRSLARLERELGLPLLERTGRRVELNPAGHVVVDYARIVLREERLMRSELDQLSSRGATLTIGSVAPAPLRVLVSRALDLDGDCLISTTTLGEDDVVRAVTERRVDLAVGLAAPELPTLEVRPLMEERLFVALPPGHALAARDAVSFAELDGETFLLQAHVGFWGRLVTREMSRSTFVLVENRAEYLALARSSRTATFVSDAGTDAHEGDGRTVVPIEDEAARAAYVLIMRSDAREAVRSLFGAAT